MKNYKKNNVLVLLNHGLGDVVMSISLLRNLLKNKNNKRVTIITKSELESKLISIFINDDRIHFISLKETNKFNIFFKLIYYRWDYFIAPQAADNFKTKLLAFFVNAKIAIGPKGKHDYYYNIKIENKQKLHKVEYYNTFNFDNEFNEIDNLCILKKLPFFNTDKEYVVIAPGSGELEIHKRLPIQTLSILANEIIKNLNLNVIIMVSPNESQILNNFECKSDLISKVVVNTLDESIEILNNSKVCICPCNGTSHLAASLDIPILSIVGPTNSGYTGPFSNKIVVVNNELECSPCYASNYLRGCGNNKCMTSITVSQLLLGLNKVLNNSFDTQLKWRDTKLSKLK